VDISVWCFANIIYLSNAGARGSGQTTCSLDVGSLRHASTLSMGLLTRNFSYQWTYTTGEEPAKTSSFKRRIRMMICMCSVFLGSHTSRSSMPQREGLCDRGRLVELGSLEHSNVFRAAPSSKYNS
jgi:hypothetical protein